VDVQLRVTDVLFCDTDDHPHRGEMAVRVSGTIYLSQEEYDRWPGYFWAMIPPDSPPERRRRNGGETLRDWMGL
jgi:hypothetical protein